MSKDKVAIYCRVSTEHIEQDQSYQAQIQYFTEKFKDRFEIIKVYADKGSGLSLKKRPQFCKMLEDSGIDLEEKKGKINTYVSSNRKAKFKYILTKSVSRFSRNTEIISIIRDLKAKGVYIIFDDINKSTESAEDTMLLEFLQSIAQEESRNKSQIIKWGKKRSAEAGNIALQSEIYGYERDFKNNKLIAIEEEAKVIQKIFNYALEGCGVRKIKRLLTEEGIYNRENKPFSEKHLMFILKNPRYCGLNVRNRFGKVDLYNPYKQREKNKSEWIVQETDKIDKIIEKEQFEKVQKLIASRANAQKGIHLAQGEFARKIKCSVCGAFYTRNRDVYKSGKSRVFYNCSNKKKNGIKACNSRNIGQDEINKEIDKYVNTDFYKKFYEFRINYFIKQLEDRKKDIIKQKSSNNLKEIDKIKGKIQEREKKLNILLENILENSSKTLKNVYNKKIKTIEDELLILEKKLKELETTEEQKQQIIENIEFFKNKLVNDKLKEFKNKEEFLEDLIYFIVRDNGLFAHVKLDKKFDFIDSIINKNLSNIKNEQKNYIKELSNNLNL